MIGALLIVIALFLVTPDSLPDREPASPPSMNVDIVEIPSTDLHLRPPAPPRPTVPVPVESEDLPEDVTIAPIEFQEYKAIDYPPSPDPEPDLTISPTPDTYLRKPEPDGGYETLRRNIEYPPLARQAGIEGTVVVRVHINVDGKVTETAIIEGIPRTGFNEAAIAGIEKTRFKPARRFDQPIAYWDSITVNFRIRDR